MYDVLCTCLCMRAACANCCCAAYVSAASVTAVVTPNSVLVYHSYMCTSKYFVYQTLRRHAFVLLDQY